MQNFVGKTNCIIRNVEVANSYFFKDQIGLSISPVILLPLHPVSRRIKIHKRHKIIHDKRPVGCKEWLINLNIFW